MNPPAVLIAKNAPTTKVAIGTIKAKAVAIRVMIGCAFSKAVTLSNTLFAKSITLTITSATTFIKGLSACNAVPFNLSKDLLTAGTCLYANAPSAV